MQSETGRIKRRNTSEKQQLASITAYTRQQLSRVAVQAQARILLDRMEGLGSGTGEAGRRREFARKLEREWEKERRPRQSWRGQGEKSTKQGAL